MENWSDATWILLLSVVMFFGSIVVGWVLIVRMPADYLTRNQPSPQHKNVSHKVKHGVAWVVRNVIGVLLFTAGFIMLFTPGQGVMFMFIGITLIDFPGKKRLINRVLGHRGTLNAINKIREKAGRPPLEVPKD